uniref:FLYWCH-type domain-containing protein n=1 Tax=Daphnia galeata TaxID=27404 RepID=A0A8J2RFE0_9CRUS|nr:unnamed protein product [Daphnia galeata]
MEGERHVRMPGARRGQMVLIDRIGEYVWHQNGRLRERNVIQYRSSDRNIHCRATLTCRNGHYLSNGQHNHENHRGRIKRFEFVNLCKEMAANSNMSLLNIYIAALRRFPGPPPVTFIEIRSSMNRAIRSNQPPIPASVEDAGRLILKFSALSDGHEWGNAILLGEN